MNWNSNINRLSERRTIPVVWVNHAWVLELGRNPGPGSEVEAGALLRIAPHPAVPPTTAARPSMQQFLRPDTVGGRPQAGLWPSEHRTSPRVCILSHRLRQTFN